MIRMSPPRLEHLRRMTDSKGLMHAAVGDCPNRFAGYDSVENADALRLCAQVSDAVQGAAMTTLARTYFEYLSRARRDDGRIYHACDAFGNWSKGNNDALVQSWLARALAAVIVSELPIAMRLRAADWWRELLAHADDAQSPRAAANWLIAIGTLRSADPGRDLERARKLANWLVDSCYAQARREHWEWFEERWEMGAACIAEGLWYAGQMLEDERYTKVAECATRFLCAEVFEGDMVVLPGTNGVWAADRPKPLYDQRPADAVALAGLLCTAEHLSGQAIYGLAAETAVRWFAGSNVRGESLIDAASGGCHDGLTANGLHPDQGGGAVVAYLLAEAARAERAVMHAEPVIYVAAVQG